MPEGYARMEDGEIVAGDTMDGDVQADVESPREGGAWDRLVGVSKSPRSAYGAYGGIFICVFMSMLGCYCVFFAPKDSGTYQQSHRAQNQQPNTPTLGTYGLQSYNGVNLDTAQDPKMDTTHSLGPLPPYKPTPYTGVGKPSLGSYGLTDSHTTHSLLNHYYNSTHTVPYTAPNYTKPTYPTPPTYQTPPTYPTPTYPTPVSIPDPVPGPIPVPTPDNMHMVDGWASPKIPPPPGPMVADSGDKKIKVGMKRISTLREVALRSGFGEVDFVKNKKDGKLTSGNQIIDLHDYMDVEYYGTIGIGDQGGSTFAMIFDTGSSNVWVPSTQSLGRCGTHSLYNHNKSKSYDADGRVFEIMYGSGPVSGYLSKDTIYTPTSGDGSEKAILSDERYTFGEILDCRGLGMMYTLGSFDGILGMAWPSISVDGITPLILDMYEKKVIDHAIFSIYLGSVIPKKLSSPSQSDVCGKYCDRHHSPSWKIFMHMINEDYDGADKMEKLFTHLNAECECEGEIVIGGWDLTHLAQKPKFTKVVSKTYWTIQSNATIMMDKRSHKGGYHKKPQDHPVEDGDVDTSETQDGGMDESDEGVVYPLDDGDDKEWVRTLSDGVNSSQMGSSQMNSSVVAGRSYLAVDSGTSLLVGPMSQVSKIRDILGAQSMVVLPSRYYIPCDQLDNKPDLEFKIPDGDMDGENFILSLSPKDYTLNIGFNFCMLLIDIMPPPHQKKMHQHLLQDPSFLVSHAADPTPHDRPNPDQIWIIGDVLMRKYYTLFDYEQARVGFGIAKA